MRRAELGLLLQDGSDSVGRSWEFSPFGRRRRLVTDMLGAPHPLLCGNAAMQVHCWAVTLWSCLVLSCLVFCCHSGIGIGAADGIAALRGCDAGEEVRFGRKDMGGGAKRQRQKPGVCSSMHARSHAATHAANRAVLRMPAADQGGQHGIKHLIQNTGTSHPGRWEKLEAMEV